MSDQESDFDKPLSERKRGEETLRQSEVRLQEANEELQVQNQELARLWEKSKQAEEVLAESDHCIRHKLDSILSPEGDIGNLDLADIIDARPLQSLVDNFYELTGMPMGLIDLNGKVLVGVGWQDVCTKFHRVNPESCRNCVESDVHLSAGVSHGEYKIYKCKNNMWDVATPVMVGDRHFGNLFMGQFFFEDEPLDYELFRAQARKYEFDEKKYIAALEAAPRLDRGTLKASMSFFMKLADILSKLSYSNLKLARSLTERDSLMEAMQKSEEQLRESRERLDLALVSSRMATFDWDIVKNKHTWSDGAHRLLGTKPETFAGTGEEFFRLIHPEDWSSVQADIDRAVETTGALETEYRAVWPDGSIHYISSRGKVHSDDAGRAVLMAGVCWDISERKRAEERLWAQARTLKALNSGIQALLHATDELSLLQAVCRTVAEDCGHAMVWIGFAEEDEKKSVRPIASAGFEEGYLETLGITWADSERGRGPTGTAIRTGKPCGCADMQSDPAFEPWRNEAIKRGYASSLVLPLMGDGKAFGALTIYSPKPNAFSEGEADLLMQLANELSYGIQTVRLRVAHDQSEEELRRAHDELERRVRERTEELAATVDALRYEIGERERMDASLLRLNRLYAVLGEIDQAIIRANNSDTLFHDICRIAVEQGGFLISWVGLLDEDSGQIRRVAAYDTAGYLDGFRISANDEEPSETMPTWLSISEGSYYICNDYLNAPCTKPWHEKARTYGIKASASVAVKEEGRVIGALTLYAGEKDFFDLQHVDLLVQMGADVSFALDNLARETRRQKTEQALREETLERLQAVEALRENERLLLQQSRQAAMGEMIGNIAHQWRQPLNTLGLKIQQLLLFYDLGEFTREFLEKGVSSSMGLIQHMSKTIDDFRNYFSPDKEKVEFKVREAIANTLSLMEGSLKNPQISIEIVVQEEPVIHGYQNEFAQVLLNILINARDALIEGDIDNPRVMITISNEGGCAVVTVADNAGGIPEEIIGKIFDPYFTTKGPQQGTGVGLFMSKTIIEKNMGGKLAVRNIDNGAEFRIEV